MSLVDELIDTVAWSTTSIFPFRHRPNPSDVLITLEIPNSVQPRVSDAYILVLVLLT